MDKGSRAAPKSSQEVLEEKARRIADQTGIRDLDKIKQVIAKTKPAQRG
eukprot:CAMPEP_0168623276 /NCGR_PEP_ID=MMETSP0449_2-20121227/8735_1 /TAXON_ID=1082188 /ORGANISM="Strombidium rassoulzadegani, Strain ras09" /LENGTH=48 /DNA_ID= /DNA_START= /DNA_END= /DNA_ORIENTATION=